MIFSIVSLRLRLTRSLRSAMATTRKRNKDLRKTRYRTPLSSSASSKTWSSKLSPLSPLLPHAFRNPNPFPSLFQLLKRFIILIFPLPRRGLKPLYRFFMGQTSSLGGPIPKLLGIFLGNPINRLFTLLLNIIQRVPPRAMSTIPAVAVIYAKSSWEKNLARSTGSLPLSTDRSRRFSKSSGKSPLEQWRLSRSLRWWRSSTCFSVCWWCLGWWSRSMSWSSSDFQVDRSLSQTLSGAQKGQEWRKQLSRFWVLILRLGNKATLTGPTSKSLELSPHKELVHRTPNWAWAWTMILSSSGINGQRSDDGPPMQYLYPLYFNY